MAPLQRDDTDGSGGERANARRLAHGNLLLASFDQDDLDRLLPHLELVHLERHRLLFRTGEPLRSVHFPLTAVVSLITRLESGETLEVGLVGRDGIAETAVFPGITSMSCDGEVQICGAALRMSADALRQVMRTNESLCCAVARFTQLTLVRSMQRSACNAFHSVQQRCARWLLTVHDLTGDDELPITQELLSAMLGVRRPTVTLVLKSLREAGLVVEPRGRIRLVDRSGLQDACCECYTAIRFDQLRLLGY